MAEMQLFDLFSSKETSSAVDCKKNSKTNLEQPDMRNSITPARIKPQNDLPHPQGRAEG